MLPGRCQRLVRDLPVGPGLAHPQVGKVHPERDLLPPSLQRERCRLGPLSGQLHPGSYTEIEQRLFEGQRGPEVGAGRGVIERIGGEVTGGVDATLVQLHHENAARRVGESGAAFQEETGEIPAPAGGDILLRGPLLQLRRLQQVVAGQGTAHRLLQRDDLPECRRRG